MKRKGFTLIELLVVIAIIAILSVVVILTLNPAELLRQSRDSNRISDLSVTKTAILLYLEDTVTANLASSSLGYSGCYISATGASATTTTHCGVFANAGAAGPGVTSTVVNDRKLDSTGWIPINFKVMTAGTPFGQLPVDPTNNLSYYYSYAASSSLVFELDTIMESQKYGKGGSNDVVSTDGGDTSTVYEVGSSLSL